MTISIMTLRLILILFAHLGVEHMSGVITSSERAIRRRASVFQTEGQIVLSFGIGVMSEIGCASQNDFF